MTILLPGAVFGAPRVWLRLEGAAVFALAALMYQRGGHSWIIFAVLFLSPDLSFMAYLTGPRRGALSYNIAHSYVGPVLTLALEIISRRPPVVGCIWAAHIGFDRALGYGLKYPSSFSDTHLGQLKGRALRAHS